MANTDTQGIYVPVVQNLSDIPPGEALTVLLYGESGVGKTRFSVTCGENVLFLNIGSGIETITNREVRKQFPNVAKFKVINIREEFKNRVVETAEAFDRTGDAIEYMIKYHRDQFDTIYLDDMTSLSQFALNKALELNASTGKSATLQESKRGKHLPLAAIQDRGGEMDAIKWFLGQMIPLCKDAGVHFICTAHDRKVYRKSAKVGDEPVLVKVMPLFTGKDHFAPSVVPAYFDNVWYMTVKGAADQAKREIQTGRDERIIAKTRHAGVLKMREEEPNFLNLLSRIRGDK